MPIADDFKLWTKENWYKWEAEKPEWFTDRLKKRFDNDMIPLEARFAVGLGGKRGRRRRSSLGELLQRDGPSVADHRAGAVAGFEGIIAVAAAGNRGGKKGTKGTEGRGGAKVEPVQR
jgi:hypothetical protein